MPALGKTTGRAGSSFVLQNWFFVSLARAGAHWCGAGKTPGEEICWECLISLECFTSILAGCTTRCGIVTTCPLIEVSKSRRLQNQTAQAGGPRSLVSASHCLARQPHLSPLGTSVRAKQILFLNSILACYHFWPVAIDTLVNSFSIDGNPARWVYHAKCSVEKTEQVSDFLQFT